MDLFELEAVLRLNTQQYDQAIDDAEKNGVGLVDRIGNAWVRAKSAYQTATKILGPAIDMISESVQKYSQYQQATGGLEAMFGDTAKTIVENAKAAFQTAGMSMNDYMDNVIGFGQSLLNSLGGDAEAAAELANQAIIQMADNANTFGTNVQDVAAIYTAISLGRYQTLEGLHLGYNGTKEELDRLLRDAEAYVKETQGLDLSFDVGNYADVIRAIGLIQEKAGIAGTTAREGEGTIAGSLSSLRASWDNLQTTLANPKASQQEKDAMTDAFTASLRAFLNNIKPVIMTAVRALIDVVIELVPDLLLELARLIPEIAGFLTSLLTDSTLLGAITKALMDAIILALASLADVLVTTLIEIFNPNYSQNGSAFSQWGVYDWLEDTLGVGKGRIRRYDRRIETPRGAVGSQGSLVEGGEETEISSEAERERILSGLMELFGFRTATGAGDYRSLWRSTFESADDDAMERNMRLLGLTGDAISGMHQEDAQMLSAMMQNVLDLESAGDLAAVTQQLHQLYAAIDLLNQGYFAGSAFTGGDLLNTVTGNFLDPGQYSSIVERIRSISTEIDEATRARTVSIGFTIGDYEEEGDGFAKGLSNVPYDNFLARLHRDEMVLTASQARDYREGNSGGTSAIVAAIEGMRNDLQNLQIVVGKKVFGQTVVDYSGKRMNGYIGKSEDRTISGYGWG